MPPCCSEHGGLRPPRNHQGDYGEDSPESVLDHARYAAPWRRELPDGRLSPPYLPESPRTGRAVSQTLAEREWMDMYGHRRACPVAGLHPELRRPLPERDGVGDLVEVMAEQWPGELSDREHEVVERYYRRRDSALAIAGVLACGVKRIEELARKVAAKARARGRGRGRALGE